MDLILIDFANSEKMADYNTYLILYKQQKSLDKDVKQLNYDWMKLDVEDTRIKDNYSQSKILFTLECQLYDKYNPHDSRDRKQKEKRCSNLKRRIESRFNEEHPERVRNTLEAFNLYLLNKSKLNALRLSVSAYHAAVSDE